MILSEFEGIDTSKYTIMVVDDIAMNARLLEKILSKFDFKVDIYTNSHLALESLSTKKPHIILLDIMMPGIDGLTFLQMMRANKTNEDVRVVMVSAVSESQEIIKAYNYGANDYITKPINIKKLTSVIAAQLKAWEDSK